MDQPRTCSFLEVYSHLYVAALSLLYYLAVGLRLQGALLPTLLALFSCSLCSLAYFKWRCCRESTLDPILAMRESGDTVNIKQFDQKQIKYCQPCKSYVKLSSKHCHLCRRCAHQFDHHCPWINCCIAAPNYRPFLKMILSSLALLTLYIISVSYLFAVNFQSLTNLDKGAFGVGVYSAIMWVLNAYLVLFHLFLICTRQSTYRYLRPPSISNSTANLGEGRNAYSMEEVSAQARPDETAL